MLNVKRQMQNVKCKISIVKCQVSNVKCKLSNLNCQLSVARRYHEISVDLVRSQKIRIAQDNKLIFSVFHHSNTSQLNINGAKNGILQGPEQISMVNREVLTQHVDTAYTIQMT